MKIAEIKKQNQGGLNQKQRNQIRPIFEMLKYRKTVLGKADWESLVRSTRQSIVNSPHQYLSDLPNESISDAAIHRMFDEFLSEID